MNKTIKTRVPPEFKLTSRARVVPRNQRHQAPPDAMKPRNTKVRVSIHLDLDILDFFKRLAEKPGALPYQTQINAVLRQTVESPEDNSDAAAQLRQAKRLIDAALRNL